MTLFERGSSMKAVSCLEGTLSVVELPSPQPAEGQLLLDVRRCGICGSDLHAKDHAEELTDVMAAVGYEHFMRSDTPVVMGHEFCGEVLERGRGAAKEFRSGTLVVSFPLRRADGGVHLIGLSPLAPGAYAERVLAEASMSFVVPNGLAPDIAALTEPMAVALHAVHRSDIGKRDVAVVVGCGPVGLAVICHLKAKGVGTIIASDFSPGRRALASRCGADVVVDPATDSPYAELATKKGVLTNVPDLYEFGVGSMEKLRKLPGWAHLYRVADTARRRWTQAAGDLRMRRGARHDRRDHRRRAGQCAGRGGRGVHGRRSTAAGPGDQQGDRPALRIRLHATGIPRHPVPAGRGQGGRLGARHGHGRARAASTPRSTHSGIPNGTRRSSSIRRVTRWGCDCIEVRRGGGDREIDTTVRSTRVPRASVESRGSARNGR